MERRTFLQSSGAATAALALGAKTMASAAEGSLKSNFKLKYAPHFGMFEHSAGSDLLEQLRFMADHGFRALEDNGMRSRSVEVQESIAQEMARLGMEQGVFVAHADFQNITFASRDPEMRSFLLDEIRDSVEVGKRVNAKWCTVVPGLSDPGQEWDYQTATVIDNLKYCAEICEETGLIMVLEPLNFTVDIPGVFLSKIPQAYMICKAVDSPCCKILNDIYHQQITEGNLIPNIDYAWEEIAYFQLGDNPGRNEPTTGEINYRNIFQHIHNKGYTGIVGMEHGKSQGGIEGEEALITKCRPLTGAILLTAFLPENNAKAMNVGAPGLCCRPIWPRAISWFKTSPKKRYMPKTPPSILPPCWPLSTSSSKTPNGPGLGRIQPCPVSRYYLRFGRPYLRRWSKIPPKTPIVRKPLHN